MALEEYQELKSRHDFLTEQQNDLQQALDVLRKTIVRINRTTTKRFLETFHLVNEKFKEVFARLFKGGQASLVLLDEQDIATTGVDIMAQPPGKKLQNIDLLSGGEKALVAIALLFGLFMIRPTPFCLLDEVDAPLDDANINRFIELVRDFSKTSQFIFITHNKEDDGDRPYPLWYYDGDPGGFKGGFSPPELTASGIQGFESACLKDRLAPTPACPKRLSAVGRDTDALFSKHPPVPVNFLSHPLSLCQGGERNVVRIVLSKEEKKVMIMGKEAFHSLGGRKAHLILEAE